MMYFLIFLILKILIKINFLNQNKNLIKSIECGFNNLSNKHLPMMNNFIIIMMIFMIFDMEMFLLIPIFLLINLINWIKLMIIMILIILFMYLSLMYEIKFNYLIWMK